jgi:phosphatidylserine decarboxylase
VTILESDQFGRMAIVEVGALRVGTIVQTYRPGRVSRGQEKGTFRMGGSTVVVLFEPDRVAFDDDLVRDSADGVEVHVRAGEPIGRGR